MKKEFYLIRKTSERNNRKQESGAVLIIVTIAMFAFMGILAMTLDIGSAYLSTGQLQKAVDAAVYSAGRMLPVRQEDTTTINAVKDSAINYARQNGYSSLTRNDVVLGSIIQGSYTDIKVSASKNVQMNFARVLGVNSIKISRRAKAKLSPILKMTGVAPLGVLQSVLDADIAANNVTHIVLKYGSGSSSQGFFGAFDLDGNGGGASDYRRWLAQGFPGETSIGDILLEEHGNMVGPTYDGFEARYGACTHFDALSGGKGCTSSHFDPTCPRIIKIVVYKLDFFGDARIVGFAAFLLEAQDRRGYITGSFIRTLTAGQGSGGNAGTSSDYGVYNLMLSE